MDTITTADGNRIFYKDWGSGPTVVLSHGWPLNADSWEDRVLFPAENGYRVVVHDRRGSGRSTRPWNGYDDDTFADDLAALFQTLDLKDVALFGFSMAGGEVARYIGRYGMARISKIGLISAVTPYMLKTPGNSAGTPMAVFDAIRAGVRADRSQFFKDVSHPSLARTARAPRFRRERSTASRRSSKRTSLRIYGSSIVRPSSSMAATTRSCDRCRGARDRNNRQKRGSEGLSGRAARPAHHPKG